MTAYRRLRIPGSSYFFTVCLQHRGSTTLIDSIDQLRVAWMRTVAEYPVTCNAIVVLPDHLHAVLTEPEDSVHFPERWRRIKARFSHAVAGDFAPNPSMVARRERGLWQRRYWEHALRSEQDMRDAMDYCIWNPVKHGVAKDPADWPYLSVNGRRMGNTAHPTV